jgi:YD repeat-containing protein
MGVHRRSNVPNTCYQYYDDLLNEVATSANHINVSRLLQLESKTISGPALAELRWDYQFISAGNRVPENPEPTCHENECNLRATATVTGPAYNAPGEPVQMNRREWSRYSFGNSFGFNESKLLKVERGYLPTILFGFSTPQIEQTTQTDYRLPVVDPVNSRIGRSLRVRGDGFTSEHPRPQTSNEITRNGVTFIALSSDFDAFHRARQFTRSNTLPNPRSQIEQIQFHDDMDRWVLGQIKKRSVTADGVTTIPLEIKHPTNPALSGFNDLAQPLYFYRFGRLSQTLDYNAQGQVHSVTYPVNRTTTLTNYHRGIPQNIAYPGASESAVVNDRGEITSHTDTTGATTEYEYDVMGRLQCISYPDGDPCDPNGATPTGWFPTLISFEEAAGTQPYNLPDGTWKRTVRTGNMANGYAVNETWYDGLWRPIYTREYDSGDQPNTTRVTRRRFDYAGREAFVSFPTNDGKDYNNYGFGIYNWFDGIGRPLRTRTDSELGALIRTYEYRPGFVTRVTNERNHYTDFSYLAYDSPSTDWPIQIDAPGTDGTSPRIVTTIERDVYGKPKTIARGQVQRLFVYDAHQRLCRSFDPEALWTVQTYDEASNIDWRAIGQAMTNAPANQCAVHLADPKQRSIYTFDARNRLEHINHPDGTHDLHFGMARSPARSSTTTSAPR